MNDTKPLIANRYEIHTLIGRGGMGNVYVGRDHETNEQIAIKHLKSDMIRSDPDVVERFTREGEILRQLDHPNIVAIRDAINEGAEHYIIMDYVDGGSLESLMKTGEQLPLNRILEIGLDLADALTRAHRLNIIHRDIKPANVLLTHDSTPLLTDFGVAHMGNRTRMTEVGSVIGTYAYLSPEACEGRLLDERADIRAFGVVLYEMVAGQRPFNGDQPASIIRQILSEEPQPIPELRPDVPQSLANLIKWMLQKDRDARIATARRVGAELETILAGREDSSQHNPILASNNADSRFATPTPSADHAAVEDGTIKLDTPQPPPANSTAPSIPSSPQTTPNRYARRALILASLPIMTVIVVLGIVLLLVAINGGNTDVDTADAPDATPPPANAFAPVPFEGDPVPDNAVLVLVAQLDPVATEPRNLSRFITDDLQQNLENSLPQQPIYVRAYPAIIRSESEAIAATERNNAAVIVWGIYTDEFVQVDISAGSFNAFPYIPFDREEVVRHTNIRARYDSIEDVFNQTLSYHIINTVTLLHLADGNAFEVLRLSLAPATITTPTVPILSDSIAAIQYRAYEALYFDEQPQASQTFLSNMELVLQRDPNALTFINRASFYLNAGQLENAMQDVAAAQRLAPNGWALPLYLSIAEVQHTQEGLQLMNDIIDIRPTDWYAIYNRGTIHYYLREFSTAEQDMDTAISFAPPTNFPYVFDALIAMRDGRFADMVESLQFVAREFPDPTYSQRLLDTTFITGALRLEQYYISAVTNIVLAQYDATLGDVDELLALLEDDPQQVTEPVDADNLPLAELYMLKGLAHCNRGEYAEAETAYTAGLELEPNFWMLYLTRNEVYFYQNKVNEALEDARAIANIDVHPQLVEAAEAGEFGDLTCENFFEYEPPADATE
jgi:serine/threonine protein kinase/tetratricopeptide (TPR) repeat protein